MSILSWNCQGLGNPWTVRGLKGLVSQKSPSIVFLSETRCTEAEMENVRKQIGFDNKLVVDCKYVEVARGKKSRRAGGLCLLWNNTVNVSLQTLSESHIDTTISSAHDSFVWRFTGIYGQPRVEDRYKTWGLLRTLSLQGNLPWVVGGDFNEIISRDDKEGGALRNARQMRCFADALEFCNLKDIKFVGPKFTWSGIRSGHVIKIRLDRFVVTEDWTSVLAASKVHHLHPNKSDHLPIWLDVKKSIGDGRRKKRRFRFEERWGIDVECKEVVADAWRVHGSGDHIEVVKEKLKETKRKLLCWSAKKFGFLPKEIANTRAHLAHFYEVGSTFDLEEKNQHETKLTSLLQQEELYWKQRSRNLWLKEGDLNTNFFHKVASERKSSNAIGGLFSANGSWCESEAGIHDIVVDYFRNMFSTSSSLDVGLVGTLMPRAITDDQNIFLEAEINREEVFEALKMMHPNKAPGPDGFSPAFFQKHWDIVGDTVVDAVRCFLAADEPIRKVNETLVVLIPKVPVPESMQQLRPISLCNVIYKIGSKVLANRLKPIMDIIISPQQGAFVPGRLITDNSLIAFEIAHSMKQRRKGRKGFCAVKLDMSKAYDRVEWSFVEKTMRDLGFGEVWIGMIMRCIKTVRYSFLVNGKVVGNIEPQRGLRQGDALSPYLFLLCGEAFSRLITKEEEAGRWRGISICRNAPCISHLLFADDSFLFARAETSDIICMQGILKAYEIISGQAINFSKSSIAFSRNIDIEEQCRLAATLGMQRVAFHDAYLGAPVSIGKNRSAPFRHLVDRLRRRTEAWSARALSAAGREVLIKSVAQAIPAYIMNCFEIPESIIAEMNGIMAKYWWGSSSAKTKMHWVKWKSLCKNKREGGLGFRDLRTFNLAILAKQGWRLLQNPNNLVSSVLKAKYFPNCSFMEASVPTNASFTWRSIVSGRRVLEVGLRYRIGDGSIAKMWVDKWMPVPYGFRPFTRPPDELARVTVSHFIDSDEGCWSEELLRASVTEMETATIMQIPLNISMGRDTLMWHSDKRGMYSVRSGYWTYSEYISRHRASGSSSGTSNGMKEIWRAIWRLEVPPKVRMLAWRLFRGFIPTRQALSRRHVRLESVECVFCGEELETAEHVLRDCIHAKAFWASCPMQTTCVYRHPRTPLIQWLIGIMEELQHDQVSLFFMLIWALWKQRNNKLWNGDDLDAHMICNLACKQLDEFKRIHHVQKAGSRRESVKWRCPPSGRVMMNVDGAFLEDEMKGGVGVVVRDDVGVGIAAIARPYKHAMSPLIMEMFALRDGLRLATQQGWSNIHIESDSILLVLAMNERRGDLSEIGTVLAECLKLSDDLGVANYVHINREANQVADRLASVACGRGVDQLWFDSMPNIIHDALLFDSNVDNIVARGLGITSPLEQVHDLALINFGEEGVLPTT